jgi:energy-converting hydrogenase Eha subunit G
MHSLVGTFITISTIVWVAKSINFIRGVSTQGPHGIFGVIMLVVSIVIYSSGFVGALLGRGMIFYKPWQHHKEVHTKMLKFHSILGRINLFWGYWVTTSGLISY